MLTVEFVDNTSFTITDIGQIDLLRKRWMDFFVGELKRQQEENAPCVWKLENCYAEGKSAGATFAGIRFQDKHTINYEILGDSCIVVVSDGKVIDLISSKQSNDEFDNYPDYIDSSTKIGIKGIARKGNIKFKKGIEIFMVTDALSDEINNGFKSNDKGEHIIKLLSSISTQNDFVVTIETLRDNEMSNDDTTMIHIKWDNDKEINIGHQTDLNGENDYSLKHDEPTVEPQLQYNKTDSVDACRISLYRRLCKLLHDMIDRDSNVDVNIDIQIDNLIKNDMDLVREILKMHLKKNQN